MRVREEKISRQKEKKKKGRKSSPVQTDGEGLDPFDDPVIVGFRLCLRDSSAKRRRKWVLHAHLDGLGLDAQNLLSLLHGHASKRAIQCGIGRLPWHVHQFGGCRLCAKVFALFPAWRLTRSFNGRLRVCSDQHRRRRRTSILR